ncbi:jg3619 [Pararge aegeria aegeria]|uniref:Jg3619 protein n=1 Tax=Pararge aegeria aegeria TaxID=348720 RepID=A0A8S4RAY8_9NEOP|nr:jg3619 [Pararge aegeria aegeria]
MTVANMKVGWLACTLALQPTGAPRSAATGQSLRSRRAQRPIRRADSSLLPIACAAACSAKRRRRRP